MDTSLVIVDKPASAHSTILTQSEIDVIIHNAEIGMSLKDTCILINKTYNDLVNQSEIAHYWEIGRARGLSAAAQTIDDHIRNGSLSAARFKLNSKGDWSMNMNLNNKEGSTSLTEATVQLVEAITTALRPYPEALKAVLATVETMLAKDEAERAEPQNKQATSYRPPILNL